MSPEIPIDRIIDMSRPFGEGAGLEEQWDSLMAKIRRGKSNTQHSGFINSLPFDKTWIPNQGHQLKTDIDKSLAGLSLQIARN